MSSSWVLYFDPDHVLLIGNWNTERRVESVTYNPREQDAPPEDVASIVPPEETPPMVKRWEPAISSTDVGEASVVILVTSIVLSFIASIGNHHSPNTLCTMFYAFH